MKIATMALSVCFYAVACVDEGPPEKTGELGRGGFKYVCYDPTLDAACLATETPVFPHAVAVGSKFKMDYYRTGEKSPLTVIGGSPKHIETDYDSLETLAKGTLALFAARNEEAIDIIHIDVAVVAELELGEWSSSNTGWKELKRIELPVGERLRIRSVPSGKSGRILAGALPHQWTIDDADIADIDTESDESVNTIEGVNTGTTRLTVAVGAVNRSYTVKVTAGAEIDTDTEPDAGDTDTDKDAGVPDDTDNDAGKE